VDYKEGDLLVAPDGKDGAVIIGITHGMNGYLSYRVLWTGHTMPVRVYKEDLDYAVSCGYEVRRERS
tara:strand:- start:1067 stop:1267 length:201 start_codon:yes stop_codon:yes gene_type:complete